MYSSTALLKMTDPTSTTLQSNDRFPPKKKRVPPEHSRIYIVVQIFEYLEKGKVKEGLGGFLPPPATIEAHLIAKLAVKDQSYFLLALYVGIINTHKRCERVYAYRTVREGKIVFFRNGFGTVLKRKHFNVVSWHSPFSHYFMNCKTAPNFIEIGGITPAKLKEAVVAVSQVFRDSQEYSLEVENE
jgi:hypothetical protein